MDILVYCKSKNVWNNFEPYTISSRQVHFINSFRFVKQLHMAIDSFIHGTFRERRQQAN